MSYTLPQSNKTTKPVSQATITEIAEKNFLKKYASQKSSLHTET